MGLFQDTDLLSPGAPMNATHGGGLESSRHLSRSNVDIPRSSGAEDPKRQLPRKRSDSSTYELDTIQQHQAFLSRWAGPVGAWGADREAHHQGRRLRRRDGPELTLRTRSCQRPHGESGAPSSSARTKGLVGQGLNHREQIPWLKGVAVLGGSLIPVRTVPKAAGSLERRGPAGPSCT